MLKINERIRWPDPKPGGHATGSETMTRILAAGVTGLALALGLTFTPLGTASAADVVVGVSWSNFQEERWKTDEAAIKAALEAAGAEYISADAQSSTAKQLSDVESLIARGATALIILAQDASAITPAIRQAAAEGIPVVGYDRLIEDPDAFYITFDNVEVGRMQAHISLKSTGCDLVRWTEKFCRWMN
jgi:D-xylose transport system substrate-binding protein